jgi:hypothetical protein
MSGGFTPLALPCGIVETTLVSVSSFWGSSGRGRYRCRKSTSERSDVSESVPGKSHTELVIESFVDRMEEIYPNLDQEEFRDAVERCVRDAIDAAGGGEESDGEEESDDEDQ